MPTLDVSQGDEGLDRGEDESKGGPRSGRPTWCVTTAPPEPANPFTHAIYKPSGQAAPSACRTPNSQAQDELAGRPGHAVPSRSLHTQPRTSWMPHSRLTSPGRTCGAFWARRTLRIAALMTHEPRMSWMPHSRLTSSGQTHATCEPRTSWTPHSRLTSPG